jgi:hypothetical protein
VYRFRTGKFAGQTLEHALLRRPADLYDRGQWAVREQANQPHLERLAQEFGRLWDLLCNAEASAACFASGCTRVARFMSFTRADYGWLPRPYCWCKRHGPEDPDFDSHKMPISMSEIGRFKTKRDRKRFAKYILQTLGIAKGTRITEEFAHRWFADIEDED